MTSSPSSAALPVSLAVIHGRSSTFAERGVCVPFTTPALAQARVRLDYAERLECLLPGFSGGKGVFVFAWRSVPEIVRITLHDRCLHREILERKANSPDGIRQAALVVASRGLAGMAAQERAIDALEADRQANVTTNFLFMLELLKSSGMDVSDFLRGRLGDDHLRDKARQALGRVAEKLKLTADALFARVEALSVELAPVGFPTTPRPGRLRELLHRLQSFRDDMTRWSRGDASEAQQLAKFIIECAAQTLDLASARLSEVDPRLTEVQQLVVSAAKSEELRRQISRLSWLLDGWDYICQLWEDSRDQPDDMQRLAICEISRIVPSIPIEELAVNDNFDQDELRSLQRRWVRPNQDWRTGGLDFEMVRRIESVKAKLS